MYVYIYIVCTQICVCIMIHFAQAVLQNWEALEYAVVDLRANSDIMLAAVKQNWRALEMIQPDLELDPAAWPGWVARCDEFAIHLLVFEAYIVFM